MNFTSRKSLRIKESSRFKRSGLQFAILSILAGVLYTDFVTSWMPVAVYAKLPYSDDLPIIVYLPKFVYTLTLRQPNPLSTYDVLNQLANGIEPETGSLLNGKIDPCYGQILSINGPNLKYACSRDSLVSPLLVGFIDREKLEHSLRCREVNKPVHAYASQPLNLDAKQAL